MITLYQFPDGWTDKLLFTLSCLLALTKPEQHWLSTDHSYVSRSRISTSEPICTCNFPQLGLEQVDEEKKSSAHTGRTRHCRQTQFRDIEQQQEHYDALLILSFLPEGRFSTNRTERACNLKDFLFSLPDQKYQGIKRCAQIIRKVELHQDTQGIKTSSLTVLFKGFSFREIFNILVKLKDIFEGNLEWKKHLYFSTVNRNPPLEFKGCIF